MMFYIRKLFVIIILVLAIPLLEYFSLGDFANFDSRTLVALGFILLAALAFGELASSVKLPKITGYLAAGIIFGPYSNIIFQTYYFSILTDDAINSLRFVNSIAIGLIALTAGLKINLKDLQSGKKTISLLILLKILLISVPVAILILLIAPVLEIFQPLSFNSILLIGVLIGILMIATSPAVSIAVINETGDQSKLSKYVLNTAVLKDILIAVLLAFILSFSKSFLADENKSLNTSILADSLGELLLSFSAAVILSLIVIGLLKYIKINRLMILLALVLFGIGLSDFFKLNAIFIFIAAGFIINNFSKYGEELNEPIEKFSLPVYLIFFTLAGAGLNLNILKLTLYASALIFLIRTIMLFFSTKIATKLAGEEKDLQNNLWFGFVSQSAMVIGFTFYITNQLPVIEEIFFSIMVSVVGLNLIFGPPLFKFAIRNYNKVWDKDLINQEKRYREKITDEIPSHKYFNIPKFEDQTLNDLIISLREKLILHLREFENQLINKRSEESLEFYYQIVEKYIDEYQKLKNLFTKGKVAGKELKEKVLLTQQEISEWFANLAIQRKTIEQQILNAEFLLQKLFDDLKDYCDNAPNYITVAQEEDKYLKEIDDNLLVLSIKSYKRLDRKIRNLLGIKSVLRRKIPYITLVKYYFEYQIALEMEKVAFMLGMERLNVLRKVKKIYDDVTHNLEELINLIAEHKDVEAISMLTIDKLDEIHAELKQEISSIGEEVETSNKNINTRLNYAFSNPFNNFLKSILKAGTIELNIKKFHFSKIYSETIKARETTLETIRFWINYLVGFLGVCERDARIFEITGKINSLINDTMISHSDTINSHLKNLIVELNSYFKNFEKDISEKDLLKFENISKIKSLIAEYRDNIIFILNEKGLSRLIVLKKTYSIVNIINSLKEKFNAIIKGYEKEIRVLDEKDFELKETRTKYIELKTLHFADILKDYFENEILQEIIKINELLNGHLSSSILELKNIENVIHYHLNTAIDEFNKLETKNIKNINEEILKIIDDTIKSSTKLLREKLKSWERQIEKYESEFEVSLTEKVYAQVTKIKEAFRKELTAELESRIKITKLQLFLININSQVKKYYSKIRKASKLIRIKTDKILKPFIREAREFLEYDSEGRSVIIYSYDQTVYDDKIYNSLPFVYKKLFDYTSSEIVEILVGREKEKTLLMQAYERTQKGLSGSTAIIGESGTGKSSLISSFLSKIQPDANIYRFNFEKTIRSEKELLKILSDILGISHISSYDEIISELNLDTKYRIIVLEDIHKIYLRKFGGLEAMKKLLLIISETSNKIFWIVSISYHAWQLLNRILNIGNYFPFQLKTEILSKEQIKEAIIKRHKTSGYNLIFLHDQESKVHKHLRLDLLNQEKQKSLEEEFFNKLYDACEGNITSALFYWVKSIKEFKNNTIFIKPLKKLDFRFLESFEIEKLLTLSNLIQHGSLTIREHQEIFKCEEEKSKSILNFLNAANLIFFEINERGEKVFYINPAVYKPVEIELRKLHIFD